ncbi:hypothetical protein N0V83_002776 [Neocucurbitaria cava]|uniref:Xylanolytic transcriptional activator regulatory domain-containing protein n=1 Tax=Neocucurbitaria cava TaxID=798079 RepID=A0A9W8YFK6_9PLEO|nr:hypothetical protein N0V83_002776 [Neocucurbitaria cava]
MPAKDDYTPADIFNDNRRPAPLQPPQQQSRQSQPSLPHPTSFQQDLPSRRTQSDSGYAIETSPPSTTSKDSSQHNALHNPFSEVQETLRNTEELIPTRHGAPHYFGPSSSFRLATTIRTLVARCKAVPGTKFPVTGAAASSQYDQANKSRNSPQPDSAYPSDEEYTDPDSMESPTQERRSRKRPRAHVEETDDRWEHSAGPLSTTTIGHLLPSRSLAEALVSAYFDHVHIYLPIFHRSMFQLQLEAMYTRKTEPLKDCVDIGWLVAMALVFAFGCQQLHEHDPEQAHKLRLKYIGVAKTYFRQLLTTTCLANVQALVLLNLHHHVVGQKSSSWLLIGLAARMAITMGMHRDGANAEFEPIERNTRRQVWWSIYTFEKILCSILGRPTVIDDKEMYMKLPDAQMLEQKSMPAEFMDSAFEVIRLSYTIRQRAYFDGTSAQERSPTIAVAESLLRECDDYFATIPAHLSLSFSPNLPCQRSRILGLHIYYFYMRCIPSRDFLVRKVERNICQLENKTPPASEDWAKTLALSEDCVESAHQGIQCIMAGTELGLIGNSWVDLYFVFHSVLIVCADFLARPKEQRDSPKDMERKATVRAMLNRVREMRDQAPTYRILSQIAIQFASITGVADDSVKSHVTSPEEMMTEAGPSLLGNSATERLLEISDVQEDWFSTATTNLGLDFFDLTQATGTVPGTVPGTIPGTVPIPLQADPATYPGGYYMDPRMTTTVDWTAGVMPTM